MITKALNWITGSDTGISSKTIWSVMMGSSLDHSGRPYDSADFGIPVVLDPEYSAFIVKARIAAKDCGYALAIHGSMMRDLDLIAIPWVEKCKNPAELITQVRYRTQCETNGHPVNEREHGRLVVSFMIRQHFSDARYVDFSIIPPNTPDHERKYPASDGSEIK